MRNICSVYSRIQYTPSSLRHQLCQRKFYILTGDVDFYFNGGWDQPGCTADLFGQLANGSLALPNGMKVFLNKQILQDNKFTGVECRTYIFIINNYY